MAEPSPHTTQMHHLLERMRSGDFEARDELFRSVCKRLERLTHKMTKTFPRVRPWVQTDDVFQNAPLRLLRSLDKLQPKSMREFFLLAAVQIRRELLDLARHFYGPHGLGTHDGGALSMDDSQGPGIE